MGNIVSDIAATGQKAVLAHGTFLIRIGVTLGAFWFLFLKIPFGEVLEKMAGANYFLLLTSLCTFILLPLTQARRWHILIQILGRTISFKESVVLTWLGLFFSSFLPSSIGGDIARAWFARHNEFNFTRSIISVGLDRIIGLSTILTIILLSTPYYYGLLHGLNASYATVGVFVGILGCFLAIATIVYADRIPIQLRKKFHLFDQLCDCASRIHLLNISSIRTWEIAGISILGQIFQPLKYYLLALAIGAEIGFLDFFFLTPFVTLAVAVPIGIAGWGVREGSMVAIFSIIGSRPEDMLAISLFSGIIVTIAALPGSISWFLLANTRKQRGE